MTRALVATFAAALLLGCPSSEPEKSAEPEAKSAPAPRPAPTPAPPPAPPDAAPEPSTPEEIELARKSAMMEGRDKDAVKYCVMAGIGSGSDPQARLGCALAACRGKDMEKARAWAKDLPKALMTQAKQICQASGAIL